MAEMKASTTGGARARHIKGAMRRYLAVALGIILLAVCSLSVDASAKGKFMLWDFQLSPDGQVVAFRYQDKRQGFLGLGLLNLKSGALSRVPNPPGKQLGFPSFSYDGKQLAAVMGETNSLSSSQVIVIDLATLRITQVTKGRAPRKYPVFQPGTGNILYVVGGLGVFYHLRLLNLFDLTETTILKKKDGFLTGIFRPAFAGSTEIIFQAYGPADSELMKAVIDLTGTKTSNIAYRLQFGGRPEILFPQVEASRKASYEPGISSLTASKNGSDAVFIHLSTIEPRTKGVGYNYELFNLKNEKLKPLTNLRSHLMSAHISYDGSTVAFSSDPKRRSQWDLFILDMKTGKTRQTHLLERLAKHPAFAPQ